MKDLLIEYSTHIFLLCLLVGLLIFRPELNKLINWIIHFRKVSKTKDGYSASADPGALGATQPSNAADKDEFLIDEVKEAETDHQETTSWSYLFFNKDYDGASEILRDRISKKSDPKKRLVEQATLGYVLFSQNGQKGACYFEELLKAGETAAIVYNFYALSAMLDKDYDKAQTVLTSGIEAFPEATELLNLLGTVLHQQGKSAEAADILMQAINRQPKEPDSYRILAQLLADIGMGDQAISCCRVGMARCPQDKDLIEKYVEFLPGKENQNERMVAYLRLSEMRENNANYLTLLGNEYLELGFNDMALEAYRKGNVAAEESEEWILANIGNILKNQGFYSYGAEYIQRAVAIDAKSQYSHERLAQAFKLAEEEQQKRDEIRAEVMGRIEAAHSLDGIVDEVRDRMSQQSHSNYAVKALIGGVPNGAPEGPKKALILQQYRSRYFRPF